MRFDESVTPEVILVEYRKLQKIRNEQPIRVFFVEFFFGKPKHQRHYDQCNTVRNVANANQESALQLMISGKFSVTEISDLLHIMRDSGGVGKKDSWRILELVAKMREHRDKLPEDVNRHLDWLEKVHGY